MVTHVQIRIRSLVIGALLVSAAVGISAEMRPTKVSEVPACFAIAREVCLSGSNKWVAQAAATLAVRGNTMLAMSGDAF